MGSCKKLKLAWVSRLEQVEEDVVLLFERLLGEHVVDFLVREDAAEVKRRRHLVMVTECEMFL